MKKASMQIKENWILQSTYQLIKKYIKIVFEWLPKRVLISGASWPFAIEHFLVLISTLFILISVKGQIGSFLKS